jgi:hypothetical protein
MLNRGFLVERRAGLSVFRAGDWREGLMGDFRALRASRKLSLMRADRSKRTSPDIGFVKFLQKKLTKTIIGICFLFWAMPKRKSKRKLVC